jgi:hypothetical protein
MINLPYTDLSSPGYTSSEIIKEHAVNACSLNKFQANKWN